MLVERRIQLAGCPGAIERNRAKGRVIKNDQLETVRALDLPAGGTSGALCVWIWITRRPRVSKRMLLEECEWDCAQKGSKGVKMAQNGSK